MLVGVDIGTSGSKAALMRADGEILATHQEEYGISTPRPGWAEQRPEMWFEKAAACIRAVAAGREKEVKGVSFSGQMHGIALIDKGGKPVRDAIIWADSRSHAEIGEIASIVGLDKFCSVTLNRAASGYGLASLLWLENNEPEALERTAAVLCPKDYVRFRLGAEPGQEASDASGTCCLDIRKVDWAWDIFETLGLPCGIFPKLSRSFDQAGVVSAGAAVLCGLPEGTPLYFGGADNCMAGIGSGMVRDGVVGINIGTGGQVGTVAGQPYFDAEYRTSTFCHPIPERWTIYGATLAAGLSLKWFRDAFFPGQPFSLLSELAARAKPGCGGLFFLPYLAGERTPWLDAKARGMFWGLSLEHGAPEMCRAVMEGVTLALEQSFQLLKKAGVRVERLLSMGGGAKSPVWLQIQADVFDMPVETAVGGDACAGAAIAAGVGSGVYKDAFEGVAAVVKGEGRKFDPIAGNVKVYEGRKEKFKQLYLRNKELFGE